ncbi:MAG TPA: hypothetical protein VHA57_11820 [Actinomycetota bacterium]|nr:hypothetical protein [Actinomycetota bacterium]
MGEGSPEAYAVGTRRIELGRPGGPPPAPIAVYAQRDVDGTVEDEA